MQYTRRTSAIARATVAVAMLAATQSCSNSDGGGGTTQPGSISMALSSNSATVAAGGTTSTIATVTRSGAFTGSIAVSVENAPAGVLASVASTGSVATVTANISIGVSGATPPGIYPLTVRGKGAGVSDAVGTFTLTVTPQSTSAITLTAQPSGPILFPSSSVAVVIQVSRTDYAGSVALSAEGLPAGVTASFAQPTTTGTVDTLMLTASSTAAFGVTNVVVRGKGTGVSDAVAQLGLSIQSSTPAPDFTISAVPTGITVALGGGAGSTTLMTSRIGGFGGVISYSFSGQPAGTSLTFPPNPTDANVITIRTLTNGIPPAAAGSYTLIVSASSPGLITKTLQIPVTITATGLVRP
ncbi:MAG TPA: hypothetical protein VGM77_06185 [Gemmatimonadales bacterium]|jgi:hypothetical protein